MLDRAENPLLPETFARWFAQRGWTPRAHQLELLAKARAGRSVLLIAPTGGGKTLAGFLPSLVELSESAGSKSPSPQTRPAPSRLVARKSAPGEGWGGGAHESRPRSLRNWQRASQPGGLHTLYISPLKALAV